MEHQPWNKGLLAPIEFSVNETEYERSKEGDEAVVGRRAVMCCGPQCRGTSAGPCGAESAKEAYVSETAKQELFGHREKDRRDGDCTDKLTDPIVLHEASGSRGNRVDS